MIGYTFIYVNPVVSKPYVVFYKSDYEVEVTAGTIKVKNVEVLNKELYYDKNRTYSIFDHTVKDPDLFEPSLLKLKKKFLLGMLSGEYKIKVR